MATAISRSEAKDLLKLVDEYRDHPDMSFTKMIQEYPPELRLKEYAFIKMLLTTYPHINRESIMKRIRTFCFPGWEQEIEHRKELPYGNSS